MSSQDPAKLLDQLISSIEKHGNRRCLCIDEQPTTIFHLFHMERKNILQKLHVTLLNTLLALVLLYQYSSLVTTINASAYDKTIHFKGSLNFVSLNDGKVNKSTLSSYR